MKLIIVRHGETDYNVKGLIQGQRDTMLTENGIKQTKALAEFFREKKIDVIYSSPLVRALDTAKIINEFHDASLIISLNLKERSFGEHEGKLGIDLDSELKGCLKDPYFTPKNGENTLHVMERIRLFLDELIDKYQSTSKVVMIVGHKVVNLCLIGSLLGWSIENLYSEKLHSTSFTTIEIDKDGNSELIDFDDTSHLDKGGLSKVEEVEGIC